MKTIFKNLRNGEIYIVNVNECYEGVEISIDDQQIIKSFENERLSMSGGGLQLIELITELIYETLNKGCLRLIVHKYNKDWNKCKLYIDDISAQYLINNIKKYNNNLSDENKLLLECLD